MVLKNDCRSLCIGPFVCFTCFTNPCTRAIRGKKRPTWSRRLELAIATLRSAARSIPRDTKALRFWVDRAIPDLILPKTVLRQKDLILFQNGSQLSCDWIWPRYLSDDLDISHKKMKLKNVITNDIFSNWSNTNSVVLYLHGGAFCLCNSSTHRALCYSIALAGNMLLFAPNYRRPPDVDIAAAVDDCYSAYLHLVQTVGIAPSRISIMGDSAGGSLTVLTLCKIRDNWPLLLPSSGVLLSPWVELNDPMFETEAKLATMPEFDYLPYDAIILFAKETMGTNEPNDPLINPIYANLANLPPLLIHAGEVEILNAQIRRFRDKAIQQNVKVEFEELVDMVHVGHMLSAFSNVAHDAIDHVAEFVNRTITT